MRIEQPSASSAQVHAEAKKRTANVERAPGRGMMSATAADKPSGKGTTPKDYPDARWSDVEGAWVVHRNGGWNRVPDQEN